MTIPLICISVEAKINVLFSALIVVACHVFFTAWTMVHVLFHKLNLPSNAGNTDLARTLTYFKNDVGQRAVTWISILRSLQFLYYGFCCGCLCSHLQNVCEDVMITLMSISISTLVKSV